MRIAAALLVIVACAVPPEAARPPGAFEDLRRVIATLDDVADAYPRAVADGQVADATRMRVLTRQLHDATVFARRLPMDEQEPLRAIEEAVAAREDPVEVVEAARALRRKLLDNHQLVLGPGAPPPRERGEALWHMLCAGCHGRTGAGDGEQGLGLVPEPKDFNDPTLLSGLAPSRTFSRISDGVPGTDMPQWGLFSTTERWALASLVFSFRHDADDVARGREVVARLDLPRSPRALADRTDAELLAELRARGLVDEDADAALAYWRGEAAFTMPPGRLGRLRARLADVLVAYRAREWKLAAAHAAAARAELAVMFDAIRVSDPEIAARLEHGVLGVQRAIAADALDGPIEREITRADALVDRAEGGVRAPSVGGGIRLALLDGLAAALALGLLAATPRRGRRRAGTAMALGLIGGGIAGALAVPGSAIAGGCLIAPVALLVIARVVPASRREEARVGVVAALVAVVVAGHGSALVGALGAAGVTPWLSGVAALGAAAIGAATLAARWSGPRVGRLRSAATTVALVVAAAAAAGRGAWMIVTSSPRPPSLLAMWRVDAVGLFPAWEALIAAALAACAVLLAATVPSRDP
jgi:high-affinity iron transporter